MLLVKILTAEEEHACRFEGAVLDGLRRSQVPGVRGNRSSYGLSLSSGNRWSFMIDLNRTSPMAMCGGIERTRRNFEHQSCT